MDAYTPANCTCFNLRKAMRVVTKVYDEALKPSGLRATQFSLLAAASSKEAIGITELAEALVTDRTTLTRNLKPLLNQGLLEIVGGEDQRQRLVTVTSMGKVTLAEALPLWRNAQARVISILGEDRWNSLIGNLNETVSKVATG